MIHEVARSQEVIKVTFAVVLTLLTGLALFAVRGELGRWIDLNPPTVTGSNIAEAD